MRLSDGVAFLPEITCSIQHMSANNFHQINRAFFVKPGLLSTLQDAGLPILRSIKILGPRVDGRLGELPEQSGPGKCVD